MRPKLARTVPDSEVIEAFTGSAPEVYEVAYNGKEIDPQSRDLLTIVLHEMAHALGISSDVSTACDEADNPPFYFVDPDFDDSFALGVKAFEFIDDGMPAFDCAHLALGGINSCKPPEQQDETVGRYIRRSQHHRRFNGRRVRVASGLELAGTIPQIACETVY